MAPSSSGGRRSSAGSKATVPPSSSVMIRVRQPDPAVDPILCSFPGGLPAALQPDNAVPAEGTSFPRFVIQKQHQRKDKKLVIGKDHACLYTAAATSVQQQQQQRPMQMCIGIYDKKRQELILQPTAEQGFVYTMSQSVPSYNANKEKEKQEAEQELMSPAERRKALFTDFGSAKKRKVLKSQEANRLNVESVVGAASVNQILDGMSASNRQAVEQETNHHHNNSNDGNGAPRLSAAEQAAVEWRKSFLPAFDENAEEPGGVYSAPKIAGPAVWRRIHNKVTACLQQDNVLEAIFEGPPKQHYQQQEDKEKKISGIVLGKNKSEEWSPALVKVIQALVPKGQAAKTQLCCAFILHHFMNLYLTLRHKKYIGGIEGDRPSFFGSPIEIGQRFLECFTTSVAGREGQTGYVMSKANKDSLCVHLFLLLLMAEGGKRMKSENIQPLAEDLQMDSKEASHLLRLAGCIVARKGDHTTAVLVTPLKFPSLKKAGRR